MLKSDAITLHNRPENRNKFPVFVWEEGEELVTYVDFTEFRWTNVFGLDSKLTEAGIPAPRNLYFVDAPDYSDRDA